MEEKQSDFTIELAKEVAKQIPVKDVYDGLAKQSVDSSGQILALIPRAINAALAPLHQWILHKEFNIAETKLLLEKKLETVDPEKIVQPEPYIAIPAIQAISYCQDNEILRNLYANLLSSAMNTDTKAEVHPAFVEIIKQLSPDEARLLSYLFGRGYEPFISLKGDFKNQEGSVSIIEYCVRESLILECEIKENIPSYLENLNRLKLIDIVHDGYLTAPGVYDPLINNKEILNYTNNTSDETYNFSTEKKYLKITNFGKTFCRVCV